VGAESQLIQSQLAPPHLQVSVQGKRHLTGPVKADREPQQKARGFRERFLAGLKPSHPLYNTPEARAARGETTKEEE
jgi:hypothetical protein